MNNHYVRWGAVEEDGAKVQHGFSHAMPLPDAKQYYRKLKTYTYNFYKELAVFDVDDLSKEEVVLKCFISLK